MILFWFICALMILLALWFILPALWQTAPNEKVDDARTANLLVYQDQLREMNADVKAGLLTETQYEQDKEELERRLLEDVGETKSKSPSKRTATRKLAYVLAVAIPVAAIVFYLAIGNPKALEPDASTPSPARTR